MASFLTGPPLWPEDKCTHSSSAWQAGLPNRPVPTYRVVHGGAAGKQKHTWATRLGGGVCPHGLSRHR